MNTAPIIAICVPLVLFGGGYLFLELMYRIGKREADKERTLLELEGATWLENELNKPMYKVVVKTKSGKTYEKVMLPNWSIYDGLSRRSLFKETSNRLAHVFIEQCISNDRYKHEDGTYIPMCEIESLRVVDA